MFEHADPVPSVASSIAAYPRATMIVLGIVAALLGFGAARQHDNLVQSVITILSTLMLLLSVKLLCLLIFRVSKSGGVIRGDGKHAVAIFAIAFTGFFIWVSAVTLLGK